MAATITVVKCPGVELKPKAVYSTVRKEDVLKWEKGIEAQDYHLQPHDELISDKNAGRIKNGHGLLEAWLVAFHEHQAINVSPADMHLLIVQALAQIVTAHPEKYRSAVVTHAGTETIIVDRDGFRMGNRQNDWVGTLPEFIEKMTPTLQPTSKALVQPFSTSTPFEYATFCLGLMDIAQSYYQYIVRTKCGIPQVEVEGSVEDWQSLRARWQAFAGTVPSLKPWFTLLDSILVHFERAKAQPKQPVDKEFWTSILKFRSRSGGDTLTGWINAFFPIGVNDGTLLHRFKYDQELRWQDLASVSLSVDMPDGLNRVPFIWRYFGTDYPAEFTMGFRGVCQTASGALRPARYWRVSLVDQANKKRRVDLF